MNILTAIVGAAMGVVAMYVLDPEAGRRRRALARDKWIRFQRQTRDALEVAARDLKNRTEGMWAERRSLLSEGGVADDVLAERVRSQLGFLVRYPSFIEVRADAGHVTLSGSVLSDEIDQLTKGVSSVRGVRQVDNQLQVYEDPHGFPGFQGEVKAKPTGQPLDLLQRRWSPATRVLVGSAGLLVPFLIARNRKTIASMIALMSSYLPYGRTRSRYLSLGRRNYLSLGGRKWSIFSSQPRWTKWSIVPSQPRWMKMKW
ncbi:MAG: BON domain-containing protein [Deltaproteobacteria bacterium]|nr:BON domain-containing protein [Deltaproteobacteria bacterium]